MPPSISSHEYGQAILQHAQSGIYPEAENVISGNLPSTALGEVSRVIAEAKEDLKVSDP